MRPVCGSGPSGFCCFVFCASRHGNSPGGILCLFHFFCHCGFDCSRTDCQKAIVSFIHRITPGGQGAVYLDPRASLIIWYLEFQIFASLLPFFRAGLTFTSGRIAPSISPCSRSKAWIFSLISTRIWLLRERPGLAPGLFCRRATGIPSAIALRGRPAFGAILPRRGLFHSFGEVKERYWENPSEILRFCP